MKNKKVEKKEVELLTVIEKGLLNKCFLYKKHGQAIYMQVKKGGSVQILDFTGHGMQYTVTSVWSLLVNNDSKSLEIDKLLSAKQISKDLFDKTYNSITSTIAKAMDIDWSPKK